jgi:hypothetical protein
MAMTSEMDPWVVLEARKEGLSVSFVADQDVNEISKALDATKLLPDLWQLRLVKVVVRLTHREHLGSGQPGYHIRSRPD